MKKTIKLYLAATVCASIYFSCSDDLELSESDNLKISETSSGTINEVDVKSISFSITSFDFPELNSIDTIVGDKIYCVISDSIPYSSLNRDLLNRYTVTDDVTDAFWLNYHWYSTIKQDTIVNFYSGAGNYMPMEFRIEGLPPFYKKHYSVSLLYETNFEITDSLTLSPIKKGSRKVISIRGMHGIPVTDYSVTLTNTATEEQVVIRTGITLDSNLYTLRFKLPTTLPVGEYSIQISRGTIEKQVPGTFKIIN